MKPVSENSPLPSSSQRDSAVPSTAALPAVWRETSTKPVKVTRAKTGQSERAQCTSLSTDQARLKVGPQRLTCEAVQSAPKSSSCIDTVFDFWEGSSMIISLVTDDWY